MTMPDTPFLGNTGVVPGSPEPGGFYGPYRGIVTNTTDPAGQNRIKAVVPQLFGNTSTETDWALPCQLPGLQSVPSPGQGVWIMFEGGDINYPVYMGMWQAEPSVAPYDPSGAAAAAQAASEAYTNTQLSAYYPTLNYSSGHLASNYTVTNAMATFLSTASLGIGTWIIHMVAGELSIPASTALVFTATQGSATATLDGHYSGLLAGVDNPDVDNVIMAMNFTAVVTVAGAIAFRCYYSTGSAPTIYYQTSTASYTNACGYTALRVQ